MDSEDTDTTIWIRVCPGMRDSRIVDRQKLKNLLTGFSHQVDHALEITEITDTGTLLASE